MLSDKIDWQGIDTDVDITHVAAPQAKRVLWGVAPTGRPHIGYLPYLVLLTQLKQRGIEPTVLLATYHGYLDGLKSTWDEIQNRCAMYHEVFESVGISLVETADFYRTPEYFDALMRLSSELSVQELLNAGDSTVKCSLESSSAAEVFYTAMQVLDVAFLDADLVLCGQDEADIYRWGLPVLAKPPTSHTCSYAYLPMCPGLTSTEMHSSDDGANKLLLDDDHKTLESRLANQLKSVDAPIVLWCRDQLLIPAGLKTEVARLESAINAASIDRVVTEMATGIVNTRESVGLKAGGFT